MLPVLVTGPAQYDWAKKMIKDKPALIRKRDFIIVKPAIIMMIKTRILNKIAIIIHITPSK